MSAGAHEAREQLLRNPHIIEGATEAASNSKYNRGRPHESKS